MDTDRQAWWEKTFSGVLIHELNHTISRQQTADKPRTARVFIMNSPALFIAIQNRRVIIIMYTIVKPFRPPGGVPTRTDDPREAIYGGISS